MGYTDFAIPSHTEAFPPGIPTARIGVSKEGNPLPPGTGIAIAKEKEMSNKRWFAAFAFVTLLPLAFVVIFAMITSKIDCNVPSTWSTSAGVEHCAVNGGK